MVRKRQDGYPLPKTPEIIAWEKEFSKLSLKDHEQKLKELGLDGGLLEEFRGHFKEKTQPNKASNK